MTNQSRNPFVNQVFGVILCRLVCKKWAQCRNPFVNQVFGVPAIALCVTSKPAKTRSQSLRKSGLWRPPLKSFEYSSFSCPSRNPFVNQVFGVNQHSRA